MGDGRDREGGRRLGCRIMSSLPPQALHDINSLRIQAGESTGVLNKMKINRTGMMVKMKQFSFVVVIPGLPALKKRAGPGRGPAPPNPDPLTAAAGGPRSKCNHRARRLVAKI